MNRDRIRKVSLVGLLILAVAAFVYFAMIRRQSRHEMAQGHFLTQPQQQRAYVRNVAQSVKPGGHVIVSTFGLEGPLKCSGLDVMRYDAESLHHQFGRRFRLVDSAKELHHTPFGTTQQFLYCYCILEE